MQMSVAAWDALTTKIVVNCFRKSKISSGNQKTTIAEDDDPFKELEEEIENLRSIQPVLVSENIDTASFSDVDAEVLAVQPPLFEDEIVTKLLKTEVMIMIMTMQSKLKMNLCIPTKETSFWKLSRPWKILLEKISYTKPNGKIYAQDF